MLGGDDEVNRKATNSINKDHSPSKLVGLNKQVRDFRPSKLKEKAQMFQDLLPSVEELTLKPPLRQRTEAACQAALIS